MMTLENAMTVLTQALKAANKMGAFELEDSAVIFTALRTVTKSVSENIENEKKRTESKGCLDELSDIQSDIDQLDFDMKEKRPKDESLKPTKK